MFWSVLKCFGNKYVYPPKAGGGISYLVVMRLSYLEHDLKRKKNISEVKKCIDHSVVSHVRAHRYTHTFYTYTGHLGKMFCVADHLLYRDQSTVGICFLPCFPHNRVSHFPQLLWPCSSEAISEYIYIKFGSGSRKGKY